MNSSAAFALIDRDRQILRSTEGFRALGIDLADPSQDAPGLESVLCGTAQTATMIVGDTSLEISAVTDAAGMPHALVGASIQGGGDLGAAGETDDWVERLTASLRETPALAWLKDTDGRHVYVNDRFTEALRVSADQIIGHTDAELQPGHSVDGPRRAIHQDGVEEFQELEYTVPAFAERPAFAAVRFVIRDADGTGVGICGLAAPLERAQMLRKEAARMLNAERQEAQTPEAAQADVLREWGLALADLQAEASVEASGEEWAPASVPPPVPATPLASASTSTSTPPPPPPDNPPMEIPLPGTSQPLDLTDRWDEVVERLNDEARRWQDEVAQSRAVVEQAEEEARQAQDELAQSRAATDQAQQEARQAQDELAQSRAATDQAQQEAKQAQDELAQSRAATDQAQQEAKQAQDELAQSRAATDQAQQDAKQAQDELAQSRAATDQAQQDAKQAQDELAQSHAAIDQAQQEAKQAQDELAQSRAAEEHAQQEARQAVSERDELTRALATEQSRNEELVNTIQQLRGAIGALGRTIDHALPAQDESPTSTAPPQFLSSATG